MLRTTIFSCLLLVPNFLFAQGKLDTSKPVRIDYSSRAWNKNPNAVDSASIILRDSKSKKIIKVQLTETDMDSGQFFGTYSVSWGDKEVTPELYLAPQEMMKSEEQMRRIEVMIQEGTLLRKPYFLRALGKGSQGITMFDTAQQATAAFEAYRKLFGSAGVSRSAMEAQQSASKIDAEKARLAAVNKQQSEREKLEQEERAKQEEQKRKQSELDESEKARRKVEANKFADKAMELYRKENYLEAGRNFAKAVDLDPSNNNFYYQYGVTLHRLEKFNQSLVILKLATGSGVNPAERDFFIGLNHLKLKENENALVAFDRVKKMNDKVMSPAAAFYEGITHYQMENYEQAKSSFEYVLDRSEDPALDKQAETYIEQIANVMAFKKEQSKKFIFTLNGGLMYDSNILSVSNSTIDAGTPTELAGYRWTYSGSVEYRPIYNITHEFSTVLAISDMYSTNKNFAAETSFQNTDPLVIDLTFPYKYKGKAFDKPFQSGITPGYETINMNSDGSGARELIVSSLFVKNDNTFVMNENWFATYLAELRSDTAKINTGGDDDQTATKISLSTVQTQFKNVKKTEATIFEGGLTQNTALGKNSTYTRFDIAGSYMMPFKWDSSLVTKLAAYYADYNKSSTGRKDTDYALTLALRKPLSESLTANFSGVYTINNSNVDANAYKKYLLMTTFSWTTSL